ncbi:MAG: hydantoinase/oxoprolinase family protein [Deltaproteobacteria bacterium]|nr:hydantoinase/oxoprolinase family protein [Deltaproteobacteria bacterium]
MWRVGIDVGGTFTDLFAWGDESRAQVSSKVLTTKHDRALGVINAIREAKIPFDRISHLMHGTTTATNALIVRDYPDPAMVTTDGFRDTIEIGRQHRELLYDPYQTKPKPIVKRRYRYTVNERMDVHGKVVRPLRRAEALAVAEKIKTNGTRSVAVAFINSYKNGAHEREMRDVIREVNPDTYVVISSETRPVFREHGRFTTTAIRAATIPVMEAYFAKLEAALEAEGFRGSLLILKSSGGITGVDYAKQHPEELIESGPAGGVAYAAYLGKLLPAYPNIIHTDVGGTSFDVSIVEDGKGLITRDHEIEWEVPCIVPMLDIHSVGAGGGSVGWVDEGGSLRVGPRSAGASPGPACYGLGGTEPTITDANLLLGRIEPTLGGKMTLDRAAAEAAMERLAAEIGLSTIETADGMIRIGCENMAQAVKKVLVSRGRDPRDFVLASFGGAGAMHACFVAESLNIPRVVMPIHAGVASAFGATAMDLRHDLEAFYFSPVAEADLEEVNALYSRLEAEAVRLLEADGVGREDIELHRTAQMRYVGQTYEVETPMPAGHLTPGAVPGIVETFHRCHEREYGVSSDDFAPALVSLGVTAIGRTESPPAVEIGAGGHPVKGEREIHFDRRWHTSTVYDGHALQPDATLAGPCIVEYEHACAVLPPNAVATVDSFGNLIIDISRALTSNA